MKRIIAISVVFALCFAAFAQQANQEPKVDRPELETNQAAVNFINYEGPHDKLDTVAQIRNIGYEMGRAIKAGATQAGAANRYFVIHSVSAADGNKLDADVFGLGVDAGVDHIRNLRLIIQGYLQGAYDYSAADGSLLARYTTIYNAVSRGNFKFFQDRYKNPVVSNLTAEKAGVSVRFDEWPGQTLMVIPLGTGAVGSLSAVDTSTLTDPKVTDQMKKDGNIGDRQSMVDLKEREAAEANQSATLQREAIAEEEKNIAKDKEEVAASQKRTEQQSAAAKKQQEEAAKKAADAKKQQEEAAKKAEQAKKDEAAGKISAEQAKKQQEEAAKKQEEAKKQQEEAAKQAEEAKKAQEEAEKQKAADEAKQQEIAQREAAQEQAKQEAAATEARAEQKTQEAQEERKDIAADQQAIIEGKEIASAAQPAPAAPVASTNPLAVSILANDSALGKLVRVNPANSQITQSSLMNTVNGRTVTLQGSRIFAIAGVDKGNGAIRLVEIDPASLEMLKQGDDDINAQSLLWQNGTDLYAVTVQNGKNYLARFNNGLAKQAQTTTEVHPYATCVFQDDKVITQKTDGSPLLLNAQTLK